MASLIVKHYNMKEQSNLLKFSTDEEILEAEKEWIRQIIRKRELTGNPIYKPHIYLEARLEILNSYLRNRKFTVLDYLELIKEATTPPPQFHKN